MTKKELAEHLNAAGAAIQVAGPMLPGPAGIAATIAGIALQAGAGIALAGKDPVIEIRRLLSALPEVKKVHGIWDEELDKKFGKV